MADVATESIRCLLIPLVEHKLLIPVSIVAEVVGYQDPAPLTQGEDEQHWLIGFTDWRGQEVPVVSMEAVMSGDRVDPGVRARIVILKCLQGQPRLPYFGIVAQQLPRLTSIAEPAVETLDELGPTPGVQFQVLANGEPALLPDVEEIESQLHALLFG